MTFAVVEFLADLGNDHPVVALRQQLAKAFLAVAISRRGINQVDAEFARQRKQVAHGVVIGNAKLLRIFNALVAADLDGAEAEGADGQAGIAERAQEVSHRVLRINVPSVAWPVDRKSTRLNSSHVKSRMPSSA